MPDGFDVVNEARRLYKEGKRAEALAELAEWLVTNPHDARGWQIVAAAQFDLGNLRRAERAARRVVALRPERPSAWSNLGTILRRAGKYRKAEWAQMKALQLDPGYPRAVLELEKIALISMNVGSVDEEPHGESDAAVDDASLDLPYLDTLAAANEEVFYCNVCCKVVADDDFDADSGLCVYCLKANYGDEPDEVAQPSPQAPPAPRVTIVQPPKPAWQQMLKNPLVILIGAAVLLLLGLMMMVMTGQR